VLDIAFITVGTDDWTPYASVDERFRRPAEVDHLVGDASRARDVLGWEPKFEFPRVLENLVRRERAVARRRASPNNRWLPTPGSRYDLTKLRAVWASVVPICTGSVGT
jgi:GDP-mannose 4,6 dehydratase